MSDAYKAAGVDLAFGNELSKLFVEASKHTWSNRDGKYGEIDSNHDSFTGLRDWSLKSLLEVPETEKMRFTQETDGMGTKPKISQRTSRYETAAFDLIAMVCDDAAANGYEPAIMTNDFQVNRLNEQLRPSMEALAAGMIDAAKQAGVAMIGGETAEQGDVIGGYGDPEKVLQFSWSGAVNAIAHADRRLTGREIRPGDTLVGIAEPGFRSNGLKFVQSILSKAYGPEWHKKIYSHGQKLGELALKPSIIYSGALVDMVGGYDLQREPKAVLHGAAHITGGGIPEKLGRMLEPSGYGAIIERPFQPSSLMHQVQRLSGAPDEEIYRILGMGQGMIIASPEPANVMLVAREHNLQAKYLGVIVNDSTIVIRSAGARTPRRKLEYRT